MCDAFRAFHQILLVMFAGMLAFDVLDRLTGDWSVTNTDWFQPVYAALIQVWGLILRTRCEGKNSVCIERGLEIVRRVLRCSKNIHAADGLKY